MLDKKTFGEVPDMVHNAVLNALDSLEHTSKKTSRKSNGWWSVSRVAVLLLAGFLVTGATVLAVSEARKSYRERMEEMDSEEVNEYYNMAVQNTNDTSVYSRELTSREWDMYDELEERYEISGVAPETQIYILKEGEVYNGKGVAYDMTKGLFFIPSEELSEEDILQIIDFEHKMVYSIYEVNLDRDKASGGWKSRFADMTSQEAEELYIICTYANKDVSGGFCMELSAADYERYDKLYKQYREEGKFPEGEVDIIQNPEEYSGNGVSYCIQDSVFYFSDKGLTDEEMLQIVDFKHKELFMFDKINTEINMGLRDDYPQVNRE